MDVLFSTVHGSRLYGLATPESDEDFYTVVDKVKTNKKKFAKQTIVDRVDSTVVDLGTFLHFCEIGVPQACEAMMSQQPIVDKIGGLRSGYRLTTQAYDRYLRTIKSFALSEGYKQKRHALRLALNLKEIGKTGRFNPTLTPQDAAWISSMANKSHGDVYGLALCTAWD